MSPTVYFVTGANRGIGLSLVTQLVAEHPDAVVYGTARDLAAATELKSLAAKHSNFVPLAADVTKVETVAAAAKYVASHHGHVDYLILNAGIADTFEPVKSFDLNVLQTHWEVNTKGAIAVYQAFYDLVAKSQEKKVIFISSLAGSVSDYFPLPSPAYGASKASLNYLVRAAAVESKADGLKVVAVHPGVVSSDMGLKSREHFDLAGDFESLTPDESAKQVLKVTHSFTGTDQFLNYTGDVAPW